MRRFATARDAKEYLISRIVAQASHDGVPLTDVERKMLYFSETHWTLPEIKQVNLEFEEKYDEDEYEKKIARLVRHIREDESDRESWEEAVLRLGSEDHYLLVLIDAGSELRSSKPAGDKLRLVLTACTIVVVFFVAEYIFDSRISNNQISKVLSELTFLVLVAGGIYLNRRTSR